MGDAIRISDERFRLVYEEGFRTWAQLYFRVADCSELPGCYLVPDALDQHPFFPRNLSLKHDKRGAVATGSSVWGSSGAPCEFGLPSFRQPVQIRVGVKEPISLSISKEIRHEPPYTSWFARNDDYLAVLVLAWAYVLSARWAELMPGPCSLAYTESQATKYNGVTTHQDSESTVINIGNISPEEARWWAAILAPSPGWKATLTLEQGTSLSPWSVHIQSSPRFAVLRTEDGFGASPLSEMAPSFSDASSYLSKFCERHNIVDQSHAALASALLIPSMSGHILQLPTPRVGIWRKAPHISDDYSDGKQLLTHTDHHIDRLLTLSCNTKGVRPILFSVFYNPSIECNAITPWLQGALAAIDHLAGNDTHIVGRMCMERSPRVAYLWLGSIILGLQEKFLQEVRYGQIPIDLHSAVWSGTVQTFMQQSVSRPLITDGYVSRADECRLLFLSQSGQHARVPVCQWRPFGSTDAKDVDVEVRVHATCEDHRLQYHGIFWKCEHDQVEFEPSRGADSQNHTDRVYAKEHRDTSDIRVFYGALNRDKEVVSENATRSIFGWLRFEGYASHEAEIWKHEWFQMSDSDEEETEECEISSGGSQEVRQSVELWLGDLIVPAGDCL